MRLLKNHAFQEGALLLIGCGLLVWYGLDGYSHAFDKNWGQSPYLFILVVAVMFALIGASLLFQAVRQLKQAAQANSEAEGSAQRGGMLRVAGLALICLLYYLALSMIKLPYIALPSVAGITPVISTFEASTVITLAVLLAYMGVRKPVLLTVLPLSATIVISLLFRSVLHVLLP